MFSIALLFAASSVAEQMAPVKQGMLQCQSPIPSTKTCDSLTRFTLVAPGRYQYESDLLLDADAGVIASQRALLTAQGNKLCEPARAADIDKFTFKIDGAPATAAETARFRAALKQKLAPLLGFNFCTEIVADAEGAHTVQYTVGGRRVPPIDYTMKWVSPKDGWKVAP